MWKPWAVAVGRGKHYSWRRGLTEAVLRRVYVGGWPAWLWGAVPGADVVRVSSFEIGTDHPALTAPLRIGFGSDFHIGPTTPPALLSHAFTTLAAMPVDVVLLGGDFVFLDATRQSLDRLGALAERLTRDLAGRPCFAVLGNHDLWTHDDRIEARLVEAGISVLHNRSQTVTGPFGLASICGLDDPWTGSPDGDGATAGAVGVRIGLCHSPDGLPFYAGREVTLMLAGHTHGGQIALPGGRPIVLPPGPYSQRLVAGHYAIDGLHVIVSRGVGATELPIRTFSPPELVELVLRPRMTTP